MSDPRLREAAKRICKEECAFKGEPACYELRDDDGKPLPWPAPRCDDPGCMALARAALAQEAQGGITQDEYDEQGAQVDGDKELRRIAGKPVPVLEAATTLEQREFKDRSEGSVGGGVPRIEASASTETASELEGESKVSAAPRVGSRSQADGSLALDSPTSQRGDGAPPAPTDPTREGPHTAECPACGDGAPCAWVGCPHPRAARLREGGA